MDKSDTHLKMPYKSSITGFAKANKVKHDGLRRIFLAKAF